MSQKAATKVKAKAAYSAAKKPAAGKVSHYGQSPKLFVEPKEFKSDTPQAGAKRKVMYGGAKYGSVKLHDADYGVQYAELEAPVEENLTREEAKLADDLVSKIAAESADVKTLCDTYGLSREELGRMTGFSLRALADWAKDKLPSKPAQRRLHEVRRLLDALAEIVKLESIPGWLHQRNEAFDSLTPLQVIELGEIDRLWAMIYDLGSSQPS